jgi:uncharacterized protein YdhG (YjbR/CyaY superfamily)
MPSNIFSGVRAPWQGLYEELREMTHKALGAFEERKTADAVIWRKNSAFAEIAARKDGLVIAFARETVFDEMNPVKVAQTSKNRVVHSYAAHDNTYFPWFVARIHEAYALTGQENPAAKKRPSPPQDSAATIDEYIACFPGDVQVILQKVRETIRAAAPLATEKITWQMPTFSHNVASRAGARRAGARRAGALIHFAAAKAHLGIYPGPEAVAHFADRLSGYKTSKGAIQFPYARPLPYDLIADMTAWLVGPQRGN